MGTGGGGTIDWVPTSAATMNTMDDGEADVVDLRGMVDSALHIVDLLRPVAKLCQKKALWIAVAVAVALTPYELVPSLLVLTVAGVLLLGNIEW